MRQLRSMQNMELCKHSPLDTHGIRRQHTPDKTGPFTCLMKFAAAAGTRSRQNFQTSARKNFLAHRHDHAPNMTVEQTRGIWTVSSSADEISARPRPLVETRPDTIRFVSIKWNLNAFALMRQCRVIRVRVSTNYTLYVQMVHESIFP